VQNFEVFQDEKPPLFRHTCGSKRFNQMPGAKTRQPEQLITPLDVHEREKGVRSMYGTIGHFRIKTSMADQFKQLMDEQALAVEHSAIQGLVAHYGYLMDADRNDYYLAVVFESRETYVANAESPEMDVRYRQWLPLLESEPDWHDGEIVNVMR
jgi:hypothetical protein